jgi:hypothetical protein
MKNLKWMSRIETGERKMVLERYERNESLWFSSLKALHVISGFQSEG